MGIGRDRLRICCVGLREGRSVPAPPAEDPFRLQVLAHPSFFRLPIVGKLLERASAKASPHLLLLKLPWEKQGGR